ncbi:hypothetical protein QL285_013510 [Trifolium repens]|nr:hypothetical protein QL285_013510 [Trifolium repens]
MGRSWVVFHVSLTAILCYMLNSLLLLLLLNRPTLGVGQNFGLKATPRLLYWPLRSKLLFLGTCGIVGITVSPGTCSWSFVTPIVKGIYVPTS